MNKPLTNGTMIDADAEDFSHGITLEPDDNIRNQWEFCLESQKSMVVMMWKDPPIRCPGLTGGICFDEKECPHKIGEMKIEGMVNGVSETQLFAHICFYVDWIKRNGMFIKKVFDKSKLEQVLKIWGINREDPKWSMAIPLGASMAELN